MTTRDSKLLIKDDFPVLKYRNYSICFKSQKLEHTATGIHVVYNKTIFFFVV